MERKGRRVMKRARDNEKVVKSKLEFTKQSGLGQKSQDLDSTNMLPLQGALNRNHYVVRFSHAQAWARLGCTG